MTDIDHMLREALRAHANSIEPSPPPTGPVELERAMNHRRVIGIAAAFVLLIGAITGLAWIRGGRSESTTAVDATDAGSWSLLSPPLSPRQFPWVLWTGQEFIVWGGVRGNTGLADGVRYNPATDTWRPMAAEPSIRPGAPAVWAGDRMVVLSQSSAHAYDPTTDTWSRLAGLDGATPGRGFTDVVWTGTDLLGVGVRRDDTGNSATLSAWRLDDSAWVLEDTIVSTAGWPSVRYSTTADQLSVHDPVALPDGLALWDGWHDGWRFALGSGWVRLPALAPYDDQDALITEGRLTAVNGELLVIALGQTSRGDDLRFAPLSDDRWGPWRTVQERAVLGSRVASLGDRVVVLGINTAHNDTPLLVVDPAAGSSTPLHGYPIDTVIDHGVGWSGTQLLVIGGQRSSQADEMSTNDTGTVSAAAALWTPSP